MKIFSWVTKDTNINFMKAAKPTFIISTILVILSFVSMATRGFNYGIDFSGGILIEVESPTAIDMESLRSQISTVKLDDVNLQTVGDSGREFIIRAQAETLDEKAQMAAVNEIKSVLGNDYEYKRVELVGPQVGSELKKAGLFASIGAILAISIYIWIRFEWQFALGAMIGLFHDLIITAGLLSFFHLDFSLTTVAALLTLAGYSVNDTVVTYDRIRENLQKFKRMPQTDLLNKSINDILSRTILTGLTTLLAATALFIWGGDALKSFSFTIVWGIIIGTYSSVYVCGTFLNLFDLRAASDERSINPFGNVE